MPEPLVFSVPETAEILRVSRTSVFALIRNEGLPFVRLGGRTVVPRVELEEWISARVQVATRPS